jgi:protease I|nr:MAG: protease [Pseudomonadota bacterium]
MDIKDAKVLIIATDGVEQVELTTPRDKLREAGATVEVAAPKNRQRPNEIRGWDHKDWGETIPVDKDLEDVDPEAYQALIIPGGQINPDLLRINDKAVQLVRHFYESGKVLAAICHGPWLLIEAGVVKGVNATSYKSIRTDMINAGANWRDEPVVVDNGVITSRNPGDLEPFVAKIMEEIREGRHHERRMAA